MTQLRPVSNIQRWWPVALWCGAILGASSIPASDLEGVGIRVNDKLVHFTEYFVFAALFVRQATLAPRRPSSAILFAAVVLGMALGGIDESYQRLIPGRIPAWGDWVADASGSLLGATLALWRFRVRDARRARRPEGEHR